MVKMLGLKIPPTCAHVGQPLSELRIAGGPRFLVVAIERGGKSIIPRGDDVILSDDLAYVVTRSENIDLVVEHFGLQSQPVRNLVVVGGGAIGRLVAQWARERGIKIRIIEKNEARCEAAGGPAGGRHHPQRRRHRHEPVGRGERGRGRRFRGGDRR